LQYRTTQVSALSQSGITLSFCIYLTSCSSHFCQRQLSGPTARTLIGMQPKPHKNQPAVAFDGAQLRRPFRQIFPVKERRVRVWPLSDDSPLHSRFEYRKRSAGPPRAPLEGMARQTSPPAPTQRLAGRAVRPPAISRKTKHSSAAQRSAAQRSAAQRQMRGGRVAALGTGTKK
jgi:hypothetical protein